MVNSYIVDTAVKTLAVSVMNSTNRHHFSSGGIIPDEGSTSLHKVLGHFEMVVAEICKCADHF